jgi:hypothetical protein
MAEIAKKRLFVLDQLKQQVPAAQLMFWIHRVA